MLNNRIKNLINEVIKLYSTRPLSQDIIDKGIETLKRVKNEISLGLGNQKEIYYYDFGRDTSKNEKKGTKLACYPFSTFSFNWISPYNAIL